MSAAWNPEIDGETVTRRDERIAEDRADRDDHDGWENARAEDRYYSTALGWGK